MYMLESLITLIGLALIGQSAARKNVLLIMIDDLRPELTFMKDVNPDFFPKIKTPNLEALANHSFVMKQAYCQQPRCLPSRTSLLTARRIESTGITGRTNWRDLPGNFTTLPQYFKEMGYQSIGIGKIFHRNKDPPSWSVPHYTAKNQWKGKSWYSVSPEERVKKPLHDDLNKDRAIQELHKLSKEANKGKTDPFFLAVGFSRPHLPFVAPKEYFDLYPLKDVELPKFPYVPNDFPEIHWSNSREIKGFRDTRALQLSEEYNSTFPDYLTLQLRRAYYASVSYVDGLVGEVLKELESSGLAENTIIAVLGDHGFLLGEHGIWAKYNVFELADLTPMMVRVPGLTDNGIVSWRLTELIDLYPSLVELAGLPQIPLCPENNPNTVTLCRQGTSFVPLIHDPERPWKPYVFSMFPLTKKIMAYSVKSDDGLRYTRHVKVTRNPGLVPDWNVMFGEEFYNHTADPHENINLMTSRVKSVKKARRRLRRALTKKGWQKSNPERLYRL